MTTTLSNAEILAEWEAKIEKDPKLFPMLQELTTPKVTKYMKHASTLTAKQAAFLLLDCKEAFYGGACWGGKSDALLMAALQYVDIPGYNAILFRKTFRDLSLPGALMDRAHEWLAGTDAKWIERDKTWSFPSTASLTFGYIEHEKDKYNYQGTAFQFIGLDEVTQIWESAYLYLFSRLVKLVNCNIPLRMRSASNPGGVGHKWVKSRFVTNKNQNGRIFIPANMHDLPYINEESKESLKELPPDIRKQLEEGDWSDPYPEGSYYAKQLEAAQTEGRIASVPHDSRVEVETWWDIGRDGTAIWFTQTIGKEIHFIDFLEGEGEGMGHYIREVKNKPYVYGNHYGPHDIEVTEFGSGLTRTEQAASLGFKFRFVLKQDFDDGINAGRAIFNQCWFDKKKCEAGLNALANYRKIWDARANTYKSMPVHDWSSHPADAFRYFALGYGARRKAQGIRNNRAKIDFNIFDAAMN